MRTLEKIISKNIFKVESSQNIRQTFDSMKKLTMTGSCNNMELFIQSRHPIANQNLKISNLQKKKEEPLVQIKQNNEENVVN